MAADFPYLYPYSRADALRLKELQQYEDSFRCNAGCARAIEQAIRDFFHETDETLGEGCAQSVLEAYGFKRVCFVLSNSLREIDFSHLISDDVQKWAQRPYVPSDGGYNHYFAVDTAAGLLESFICQTREAYQALGMFEGTHCLAGSEGMDYEGKVLVLSPDTLKEGYWSPQNQLWLAEDGFGCSPTASGRAVYATCLEDGEKTRWNRENFIGVLDEQYLPDWAAEKLAELRGPQQDQPEATSGGMELR